MSWLARQYYYGHANVDHLQKPVSKCGSILQSHCAMHELEYDLYTSFPFSYVNCSQSLLHAIHVQIIISYDKISFHGG